MLKILCFLGDGGRILGLVCKESGLCCASVKR